VGDNKVTSFSISSGLSLDLNSFREVVDGGSTLIVMLEILLKPYVQVRNLNTTAK